MVFSVYFNNKTYCIIFCVHVFSCIFVLYFTLFNIGGVHRLIKYGYDSIYEPIVYKFLLYHDDYFNFVSNVDICNDFRMFDYRTIINVMNSPGIGVYEPVWNIYKCLQSLYFDNDAHCIRLISVVNHIVNGFLLLLYSSLILEHRSNAAVTGLPTPIPTVCILCFLFVIHPINVSVVAWPSAQGYVLALTFALISSISLEYSLSKLALNRREICGAYVFMFISLVTYGIAVLVGLNCVILLYL